MSRYDLPKLEDGSFGRSPRLQAALRHVRELEIRDDWSVVVRVLFKSGLVLEGSMYYWEGWDFTLHLRDNLRCLDYRLENGPFDFCECAWHKANIADPGFHFGWDEVLDVVPVEDCIAPPLQWRGQ